MIEALAFVLLRQAFPIQLCSLKQRQRTHDVGACKCEGILDGTVDVAFCCKMYDSVHLVLLHYVHNCLEVADVALHESIVRTVLDVLEVGKVASVCELIDVDDVVFWILVYKQSYHMRAYKSGSTSYDNVLHSLLFFND